MATFSEQGFRRLKYQRLAHLALIIGRFLMKRRPDRHEID